MEHNANKQPVERGRRRVPGVRLDREAERLLAALAAEGAYAFPDPTGDCLILRSGGTGTSLGGGRYMTASGTALLTAGLVERSKDNHTHLVIAAPGHAWLRRREAPGEIAYLAQHLDLVPTEAGDATLQDASESPLAWMARRRGRDGAPLIDAARFEAGERLRRDITLGALLPRTTSDWSGLRVDGSGPRDPSSGSLTMLAARERVETALAAVGSDLSGLLIDLCGFLKGLERIEAERSWPARSAKLVARIALGRLAEHYGLELQATGPERSRTRLWRAAV